MRALNLDMNLNYNLDMNSHRPSRAWSLVWIMLMAMAIPARARDGVGAGAGELSDDERRTLFPADDTRLYQPLRKLPAGAKSIGLVRVVRGIRSDGSKSVKGWTDLEVDQISRAELEKHPAIHKRIAFSINEATLREESFPLLAELAALLAEHPEHMVEVGGHTDRSTGTTEWNEELSFQRARAVHDHLVNRHQIETRRLSVGGYGSSMPLERHEDTEAARSANRRVEFRNLGALP